MDIKENTKRISFLAMLSSMLIFGTIGIFRKYIPIPSAMLASLRGVIGGTFLIIYTRIIGKKLDFDYTKKQIVLLCATGIVLGLNWIMLFEAYNYTSVAIATVCYYMQPTIVILLSPILFHEKLSERKGICVVGTIIGISLISGLTNIDEIVMSDIKGIGLGIFAAILYAGVIILNKKNPTKDAYSKTIIQLYTSAIVLLPYILMLGNNYEIQMDAKAILMIGIVGIVHTGIAYTLYFGSMENLNSQTIAIMSYIDPVFAIILSAILLRENMNLATFIGAVLVIGSAFISETEKKTTQIG